MSTPATVEQLDRFLVDVRSHTLVSGMPFKAAQLAAVIEETAGNTEAAGAH
ncbi:hypothetical protein ACIPC1_33150 [Streptomyces sp. NPDC087263]|uniref:hypothetical protein n=1 Tax=Streptomyces sp. NPDC087263 TaxID=3365773 RepID=UPI0037FC66A3